MMTDVVTMTLSPSRLLLPPRLASAPPSGIIAAPPAALLLTAPPPPTPPRRLATMQPTPLLVGAAATTAARHWHRHPPLRLLLLAVISHSLSLRPSIAHDTTGYARDAAVAEASGVTASPADVRCVTTDAALLPLYQKSLFRDLDAWRLGAPYPMSKFEKLVTNGANHFGGERIVMIKNGHWTYPFHERNDSVYFFPGDPDGPAPNGRGVTSWITASQYYFNTFAKQWGIDFPDVIFHFGARSTTAEHNSSRVLTHRSMCPPPGRLGSRLSQSSPTIASDSP